MKILYPLVVYIFIVFNVTAQKSLNYTFFNQKSNIDFNSHELISYLSTDQDLSEGFNLIKDSEDFHTLSLQIEDEELQIVIYQQSILSDSYTSIAKTEAGHWLLEKPNARTYRGYVNDQEKSSVRFTVYNDKVIGAFRHNGISYALEPMSHYSNNKQDGYVLYNEKNVDIVNAPICSHKSHVEKSIKESIEQRSAGDCYELDLAIAIDNSMVDKHGSVANAINHTIAIINNVSLNYELNGTTNFVDQIDFRIITHFVSTCESCDPWTSSLNINQLLTDLTVWSLNDGFGLDYDLAQLWTNRDFSSSAVGLANQASTLVCNGLGSHVLQDWTSSIPLLRTTTSHEIGHNLNANHVGGSGMIMSSIVSNTNDWSPTTQSAINSEISHSISSCTTSCNANGTSPCDEIENLAIENISNTGFTVTWDPVSAGSKLIEVFSYPDNVVIDILNTTLNSVTLSPPGYMPCNKYGVRVVHYCGSGNDSGKKEIIFESPTSGGCARFGSNKSMFWSGQQVSFIDQSVNASSWLWDFGDGNTSTIQNPNHTYSSEGFYHVSLTVNGGIHQLVKTDYIKILPDRNLPYRPIDGGNFDTNIEDFASDVISGDRSMFELGLGGNSLPSTSNVWKTGLMNNVGNQENSSALYSPRFDMSVGGTYILEFDMGMQIFFCNGPMSAQVQYSTDNGSNWTRLGSYGDSGTGISGWYTGGPGSPCPLSTLVFPDQTGWAFIGNNQHKSYDISFLAGNAGVIFRIVFNVSSAFSAGYDVDGILIDNFEIKASLNALAIKELYLNAKRLDDNDIQLHWQVKGEQGISKYLIQRSQDANEFETIGEKLAKNQTDGTNYQFTDKNALNSDSYYRLKIIDTDGGVEYSELKYISAKSMEPEYTITVFPNPVSNNIIYIAAQTPMDYTYKIFDVNGVLKRDGYFENDEKDQKINLEGFAQGVYFICIQDQNGHSTIKRLVKQ